MIKLKGIHTFAVCGIYSATKSIKSLKKGTWSDLSKTLQRSFSGAFITVTVVRMSPDLGLAKVYLSFLAVKNKAELLKSIRDQKGAVKKYLSISIGKFMRRIPELHFYLDDSAEYAQEIDLLLKGPKPDK